MNFPTWELSLFLSPRLSAYCGEFSWIIFMLYKWIFLMFNAGLPGHNQWSLPSLHRNCAMVYGVKRIYVKALEKMWVFFTEPNILWPFIWKTRSIDLLLLAISGRVMPSQSSNKRVTRIQPVILSIWVWHRFMTNFHSLWRWPHF